MTHDEILAQINAVFAGVFERPDIVIHEGSTAADVSGWDSLNHTVLIAKVQEHFKVKFSLREVMRFQNVGDLCRLVEQKLGG
jgi:acyl carrier protein